jgi:hypothetical protein
MHFINVSELKTEVSEKWSGPRNPPVTASVVTMRATRSGHRRHEEASPPPCVRAIQGLSSAIDMRAASIHTPPVFEVW